MYRVIKRVIDVLICSIAIIILLPVFFIIVLAIKIDSPGPVIFKQKRAGLHMKSFYIYKFRTMYIDAPSYRPTCQLGSSDKYITKIGKFLRATSLDELPQLINILKGEMSIVGPRPVIYDEEILLKLRQQKNIYDLLPGITGWAQINGRDELGISAKVEYDFYYFNNISLMLDLKIMLLTVFKVIKKEGVVEGVEVEVELGEYQNRNNAQKVI